MIQSKLIYQRKYPQTFYVVDKEKEDYKTKTNKKKRENVIELKSNAKIIIIIDEKHIALIINTHSQNPSYIFVLIILLKT